MKMQVIRYHDDVVRCFVDTEFYEDGSTIDLISLGAVRSDGEEFYLVNREAKLHLVSPWVREHVLPQLPVYGSPEWQPRGVIADRFSRFLTGDQRPAGTPGRREPVSEVWGYYADYDWVVIAQMYGTMMGLPNHFPKYCLDLKQLSVQLGSPLHPEQVKGAHNALEDARYHRELYSFLRGARDTSGHWLQLEEEERQMLLMALAHLSVKRPGFDDLLNRIASRIDNVKEGRGEMYDEFRRFSGESE